MDSSTPGQPTPVPATANGYTPGNSWGSWFRNYSALLAGSMNKDGQRAWRHDRDILNEETDCRRCERNRDFLLNYNATIVFLKDHINKLGADLNRDNIRCVRCDNSTEIAGRGFGKSGGMDARFGIELCANELDTRSQMADTMAHEMIHAWDELRFKLKKNDLRHWACTEIRASNLSGECRFMREVWGRGQWKFTRQHQECVRRRAILSISMRPECKDRQEATRVVDEVWESCTKDTRPFDEIYR